MSQLIPAALNSLDQDATTPEFISFFAGGRFFSQPQDGGGVFALGQADQTNRIFFGPGGNDVASGENETDIISSGDGDDNIQGAGGNDFLFAGAGDDIVRGDAGDDVVVGQEGSDVAIGGTGSDIFEFFASQFTSGETDVILDFMTDDDAIVIVGSTDVTYDAVSGLVSVDGVEVIEAAPGLQVEVVTRANSSYIVGASADLSVLGVANEPVDQTLENALVNQAASSTDTALETLAPNSIIGDGFTAFFDGARFFDTAQAAGGVYVQGDDDSTNVIFFASRRRCHWWK